MNSSISIRDRILGGLWGGAVGDALGVPVEFRSREELRREPVNGMRGYGTHNQPPGTWSDDTSLSLCTTESLLSGFNPAHMGQCFLKWYQEALWTPHGSLFDVGVTTSDALNRIAGGVPADQAGGCEESGNGNGSLMRILPIALRFAQEPSAIMLDRAHRVSAITHRHRRSQMACGFFCLLVRELLEGFDRQQAYSSALKAFGVHYAQSPSEGEIRPFDQIRRGDLASLSEMDIISSGYVVHTLTASVWCLLTCDTFDKTVLRAVSLGDDTDTTGCVAGGLAGVLYGVEAIPCGWIGQLARKDDLERLFASFADACDGAQPRTNLE